jgi:uncharacterized membrane protein
MEAVEHTIIVAVPVRDAYRRWTEFEQFPEFMEGVAEVRRLDDTHVRWRVHSAGGEREFDAEIIEQRPGERVAWRAAEHSGAVSFEALPSGGTRIHARLEESDVAELSARRLQRDLERFKAMAEGAGAPAAGDADLAPGAGEPAVGSPGGLDPQHRQAGV